jgi:hypothetical protein
MITNITANNAGSLLYVSTGGSSMPYINMSAPSSGMVRYNGNSQCMEVYDGNSNVWIQLYGKSVDINVNGEAVAAVEWAKKRMKEESEWEKLAVTNEAVKIALESMKKARQQLDITAKLVKEHNETTS